MIFVKRSESNFESFNRLASLKFIRFNYEGMGNDELDGIRHDHVWVHHDGYSNRGHLDDHHVVRHVLEHNDHENESESENGKENVFLEHNDLYHYNDQFYHHDDHLYHDHDHRNNDLHDIHDVLHVHDVIQQ